MSIFDDAAPGAAALTRTQRLRKIARDKRWNAAQKLRATMTAEELAEEEERLAAEAEAMLRERRNAA